MLRYIPGNFSFVVNENQRLMLSTAYRELSKRRRLSTPNGTRSGTYWDVIHDPNNEEEIQHAINTADEARPGGGHSGLTMAFTFSAMKNIAVLGWRGYVNEYLQEHAEMPATVPQRARASTWTNPLSRFTRSRSSIIHPTIAQAQGYDEMLQTVIIPHPFDYENQNEDENICSICQEPLFDNTETPVVALSTGTPAENDVAANIIRCGHKFHDRCIREWVETHRHTTCPLCRKPIRKIYPVYVTEERTDNANRPVKVSCSSKGCSIMGGKSRKSRRSNSNKKRKTRRTKLGNKVKKHAKNK